MSATLGVDAGSREVKFAVVNRDGVVFKTMMDTVEFYIKAGAGDGQVDISKLDTLDNAPSYDRLISTGYGRNNLRVKGGSTLPEIMAHTAGAVFQTRLSDFTLVDLGGQDTKVICVKRGMVDDFVMNDKCAAGSGRYLENIARALGASMEELGSCYENPATMSSTCAIFGESEVVGLISEGTPLESILAGANKTVVMRLLPMINKFRTGRIVATGGVAKNEAIRRMLSAQTGLEVIVPDEPQLNGAIGCGVEGSGSR